MRPTCRAAAPLHPGGWARMARTGGLPLKWSCAAGGDQAGHYRAGGITIGLEASPQASLDVALLSGQSQDDTDAEQQ